MTRIIEATREDGMRQLLPTSLFRGYAAEAREVDKAVADFYDPQGDLFQEGKE